MDSVEGVAVKIIRFLVNHAHCTECGNQYRAEDVYVLDQAGPRVWHLAAVCHSCYTLSVVRAVVRPHRGQLDLSNVGPRPTVAHRLNELTPAEARHFDELGPIDAEDVLDVSDFLVSFDGDFRGLFGREPEET